jgi:hypothetical protein
MESGREAGRWQALSLDRVVSSLENGARSASSCPSYPEDVSLGKFVLMVVLVLGAALYFPQTRPTVLAILRPVLNPVLVWQTKSEMGQIIRELQAMDREGRQLPQPGQEFQAWMERNFQGGSLQDSWGSPYALRLWTDSLAVVSLGPDLEIHTADDVVRTVEIQRRPGR